MARVGAQTVRVKALKTPEHAATGKRIMTCKLTGRVKSKVAIATDIEPVVVVRPLARPPFNAGSTDFVIVFPSSFIAAEPELSGKLAPHQHRRATNPRQPTVFHRYGCRLSSATG